MESLRIQRGVGCPFVFRASPFPTFAGSCPSIDVFDLAAPLPKRECTAHSGLNPWVYPAPSSADIH